MTINSGQAFYLNAMDIDVWCERTQPACAATPEDSIDPVPANSWQLPAGALASWLLNRQVSAHRNVSRGSPQLLIIGEAGEQEASAADLMAGASADLLQSMLSAIGQQIEHIGLIQLAPDGQAGESDVAQLLGNFSGKAILFMSALPTTLTVDAFAGHGVPGQTCAGVPLIASIHPAHLLVNAEVKRTAWEDLKQIRTLLGS